MHKRRHPTILQQLERESRQQHPELHAPRRTRPQGPPRRLRWQDRVFITLACLLAALLLLRLETAGAQEPAPWGLTLQAGDLTRLQLALDTTMHAEVNGLIARVHVVQSFRNDGQDWMEGTYRFPLPDGAAVDRLYIQVGERVLEGEIHEREAARRVYQQARSEGRSAGLVSQERHHQFSTRLANIGPGETVHVMIGFLATVDYREGAFRLRLPTTFTPSWGAEPGPASGQAPPRPELASMDSIRGHRFSLQVDLAADMPIATVESLHHDVDIQPLEDRYQVTLLNPEERTDRAFELRWTPEFGTLPRSTLSTWSDGGDVYAQLMLVPPRDEALQPLPREVVFVIDTSGSMAGASLVQARSALLEAMEALGPGDRFNLIQFNSITEPLFRRAVPVTRGTLETARAWVEGLESDGGTDMAPALRRALQGTSLEDPGHDPARRLVRQVVFITDGGIGNDGELLGQIADRLGDSRLFTVGIGAAPNTAFMRKAAEIGRGHYTHIGRVEDVAATMGDLWGHIRLPAVSDLCIDWGMEAEYYPEILPDLYAGEPLWIMARLPREPDLVSLCGELNGQAWQHDAWPEVGTGQDTLATLWARRKIESLQDSLLFGADPEAMRESITGVALEHRLLTPWTSLVAVDRTPVRPQGEGLAATTVPGLLPAGSVAGQGFPATATGWKAQLLLSLLVLAISGGLFLRPFAPLPAVFTRWPVLRIRRARHAARP